MPTPLRNLPTWDRLLRTIGALIAGALAVQAPSSGLFFWGMLALASFLALSALAGFCPARAMAARLWRRACR